jgi:hypothetical protein
MMIQRLKFAFLTLLVAGAIWFAPLARADEWNKETVLTFNKPIEIPERSCRRGPTFSSWLTVSPIGTSFRSPVKIRNIFLRRSWRYRITVRSQRTRL